MIDYARKRDDYCHDADITIDSLHRIMRWPAPEIPEFPNSPGIYEYRGRISPKP